MSEPAPPALWKRALPWVLPPVLVLAVIVLLLLYFEASPPVPFHYTSP
jgi:hypothetical protein